MSAERRPLSQTQVDAAFDALDAAHDRAYHVHAAECCWPFGGVTAALDAALAAQEGERGGAEVKQCGWCAGSGHTTDEHNRAGVAAAVPDFGCGDCHVAGGHHPNCPKGLPPLRIPIGCECLYAWRSLGRVYDQDMGKAWVRAITEPACPLHGDRERADRIEGRP